MRYLLLVLLLSNCAAEHRSMGHGEYLVECRRTMANCYEEAAKLCKSGYDTKNQAVEEHGGSMVVSCQAH